MCPDRRGATDGVDTEIPSLAGLEQFRKNVSVVVLNYQRPVTTLECLDALDEARSELIKEIIVVDNGSDPECVATLQSRADDLVHILPIGVNRYFGEGNNIGVEAATGDFLVLLNNDAFVQPGWIEHLASTMAADPTVAAVGPMFLYPDGRVQEVGGVVLPNGEITQVGKGAVWLPPHYTEVCTVDFCSAACLLMRTADFLSAGGFGFEYEPAYYEDVDLCLTIARHFGRVVVNPRARVVHLESHTTTDRALQLHDMVELNRRKFVNVWGEWLSRRQAAGTAFDQAGSEPTVPWGTEVYPPGFTARRPPGTPTVVLYCPYELIPGGGERVMFELGSHLAGELAGAEVIVATPHAYSNTRIQQLARAFGIEDFNLRTQPFDSIDRSTIELGVVLGNAVTPPTAPFGKKNVYICQFPLPISDEHVAVYRSWLSQYDEVWVYSDFVRHYVSGMANYYEMDPPPIRVIYAPATWRDPVGARPWPERRLMLTVGRFFRGGHDKRQDIAIEAMRILASDPAFPLSLAVVGSLHAIPDSRERFQELTELAEGIDCHFYPNVGRNRLGALYADSAILIHAAGFEVNALHYPERLEHFGITPIEAASFGCIPVVYDEGGPAEVLPFLGCNTGFHTVAECVGIIRRLVGDPEGSTALSNELPERAAQFSAEAFRERITKALGDLSITGPW